MIDGHGGDDPLVSPPPAQASRGSLATQRLKRFTAKILRKVPSPLLAVPEPEQPKAFVPTRSRRIAAQPLSRVPASKRGEILVMKLMGMMEDRAKPSTASKQVYDSILVDQLSESHAEAMRELFLVAGPVERPWRRACMRA